MPRYEATHKVEEGATRATRSRGFIPLSIRPEAVLLNYTNPTNIVTEAVSRNTDVRILGLCDQPSHDAEVFARALGHADADVKVQSVGLNHAAWGVGLLIDGQEALPLSEEAMRAAAADESFSAENLILHCTGAALVAFAGAEEASQHRQRKPD